MTQNGIVLVVSISE